MLVGAANITAPIEAVAIAAATNMFRLNIDAPFEWL